GPGRGRGRRASAGRRDPARDPGGADRRRRVHGRAPGPRTGRRRETAAEHRAGPGRGARRGGGLLRRRPRPRHGHVPHPGAGAAAQVRLPARLGTGEGGQPRDQPRRARVLRALGARGAGPGAAARRGQPRGRLRGGP
ncbi:hypothetical protein BLX88_05680, partial [Bacillus obstructivus]